MISSTKQTENRSPKQNGSSITPAQHNFKFNIRNYVNYTRFLIILITLLFTLGGSYYAFFLNPQYQATVLLSSKIYGSLSANSQANDKMLPVDDKDTSAPRQLVLVQTQTLLRKLVDKLHLNLTIETNNSSVLPSCLSIDKLTSPMSLNKTDVVITVEEQNAYNVEVPSINFSAKGKIGNLEKYKLPDGEDLELLIDKITAPHNTKFTVTKIALGETVNKIMGNLVFDAPGVDNKLVTNILSITYTGMDPQKVVEIVNTLADIAVSLSKEEERSEAAAMVSVMEIEKKNILDLLNIKGEELAVLSMDLNHVGYDEKIFSKYFADELTQIDANIAQAHSDLSKLAQTVTSKNLLYQEALAAYQSFVGQKNEIKQQIAKSVSSGNILVDVQRDLVAYTTIYEETCKNLQQYTSRLLDPIGDLRIVEYACEPDTPSSLSRPVIILLSAIVGLICGYVVALVFD